ncbi:MAG: divergent polysaccharide deacetylase family protein [Desulfobacterales bacterium]|nr:divergent polysaccharide deacetylase family protein [Desulfobacterales bacterium]
MAYARRRPAVKRGAPPGRGRRRGRKIPLFFKFLVFLGVLFSIILYIHLKQPPPFAERVRAVDQLIVAQLSQLEIPHGAIQKRGEEQRLGNKTWTLSRWEVTLPQGVEAERVTSQLAQRIQDACPGVTLTESKAQDGTREVDIKVDNLLAHHLIFHPPRIKLPPVRPPRPRMAIVVDDLGPDKRIAAEFLRLDAPLTFSILPLQAHSRDIAQKAHAQGREVILHLPLEPRGFPLKDPGKGALFVAMSERELLRQLRKDLDSVPFITGVNNHMGSRFMEHGAAVRLVLGELKKRGFFFLDSRTTAKTQGYQIARKLALLAGERDIFLDNENDVQDIRAQLEGLIRFARDHGKAIGICHPYPSTITALRGMIAKIKAAGIRIVPLSQALD